MLGCGGGGDRLDTLAVMASRVKVGVSPVGGGSILELDAASKGCLDTGRFEFVREALGLGVAEAPLDSPIVIRMNSLTIPSSL